MKMKKYFVVLCCCIYLQNIKAQKVNDLEINFEYQQQPLIPLNKDIKNYSSSVILTYEEKILADNKKLQDEYEREMDLYPQILAEAEKLYQDELVRYDNAMVEWNKKSNGDKFVEKKILQENNKPVKPYFSKPSQPYLKTTDHQKIFNKELLANSYLKLDGYKKSPDNAVKITVTLYGFENTEPQLKTKTSSYYDAQSKMTRSKNTNWYELTYKHPMNLKIETPAEGVIYDQIMEATADFKTAYSASVENQTPYFDRKSFLQNLQDQAVQENLKYIHEWLNSNYGYPAIKRTTEFFKIEPKKFEYPDYQLAYENITAGYSLILSDKKSAYEKIKKAIPFLEKELSEYEPGNKKARVDKDVAIATRFNLTEAYIWVQEFAKADDHLTKLMGLDPSKKELKLIESYRELLKDQKARWNSNQL